MKFLCSVCWGLLIIEIFFINYSQPVFGGRDEPEVLHNLSVLDGPNKIKHRIINVGKNHRKLTTYIAQIKVIGYKYPLVYGLYMVQDPISSLFWWDFRPIYYEEGIIASSFLESRIEEYRFLIDDHSLVSFHLRGRGLMILRSTTTSESVESSMFAIINVLRIYTKDPNKYPVPSNQVIDLTPVLGNDFFWGTKFVAQERPAKLIDVISRSKVWTVIVDGPDGERATLTIDKKTVSATRNSFPGYPESIEKVK